jgi:hypothetical protein
VKRLEQQRLFGLVVEELATLGDPVNRALELDIGGAEIVLSLYDMPTGPQ